MSAEQNIALHWDVIRRACRGISDRQRRRSIIMRSLEGIARAKDPHYRELSFVEV